MRHSFSESLSLSHSQSDAPWWGEVYRQAFPSLLSFECVRDDGWAQRGGIDRVLVLKSGKTLTVDEKVRSRDYHDILFERWSSRDSRTPGWIQKDLACDYIAYAFIPSRRCLLLPFQQMRRAWLANGKHWIAEAKAGRNGFRVVEANNGTYVTESIAVPEATALKAIENAMKVSWQ